MTTTAAITMKPAPETRHDVFQGKRLIGFLSLMTLRGVTGWRFISNREDIAAKLPVPPVVYITPDDALPALAALLDARN